MTSIQFPQVRPVVVNLLSQAEEHFRNGEGKHAEAFYRAAVAADFSPLSSIELATFLHHQQHCEEAILLLMQAWEQSKRFNLPALRAQACHNLAAIFRDQNELERAYQFQQLAITAELDQFDVAGNCELSSNCELSEEVRLGSALDDLAQGDLYEAKQALVTLEKSSDDPETRSVCHLNLAKIALQEDQSTKALGHAQAAFTIVKHAHDAPTVLSCLELIVELLTQSGHWREAEVCLDQACDIADRLETRHTTQHLKFKRTKLKNALGFLNADPQLN